MLELRKIQKMYNQGTVNEMCLFHDFDFSIEGGEFVSVVGSNGSGKTSMLNIICGSIPIDSGDIVLDGRSIARQSEFARARYMGRVFQNPTFGTCPELTIFENMSLADNKNGAYGLTRGVNKRRYEEYRQMLADIGLGLEDKMETRVGVLSGGQRQAMALIMSTMTPIDFLILDEHTAALDPKTADTIMRLTDKIVRQKGVTTVMVTHNLRYAVEYGTRLVMMHQGRAIIDKKGTEKQAVSVDEILAKFNEISIECGN